MTYKFLTMVRKSSDGNFFKKSGCGDASPQKYRYSLSDLLTLETANHKIFKFTLEGRDPQYIQIKTQSVRDGVKMIQMIDISQKILYDEMKAEKALLTLITATVSHELRNPLYSLISTIEKVDEKMELFWEVI